jgi:hypothetical protein
MSRQPYPSDSQWAKLEEFIPAPKDELQESKYEWREIVNAMLSVNRIHGLQRASGYWSQ